MDARSEYDERVKKRIYQAEPISVTAGEAAPSSITSAGQKVGGEMAQTGAAQGNALTTAGGAMMMSGNPYLMAGGLGLTVIGAGEQNKRAAEEKQRQEYNERIARRQEMLSQMANMGIQ